MYTFFKDDEHGQFLLTIITEILNTYRKRREIITNRRKLKGSGIVIAEDLTQKNQKLFAQTRAAQKIKSAWTSDGRIIALISASNGKTMTKLITIEEDLEKFK